MVSMRKRKLQAKYRLVHRKGRSIAVVFDHCPWKEVASGCHTDSDAIKWAEDYLEQEGIKRSAVPSLQEYAEGFFLREDPASLRHRDRAFKKEKRPRWYVQSQAYLDNYILPRFGAYPLDSITAVSIENWLIDVDGKRAGDLSGGTRVKILQALRYVLDDAVRMGYIKVNPAKQCMAPSDKPETEKRPLTIWEQGQLFPADKDKRVEVWGSLMWASYFSVMFDTGFRPAEVAGLRISDVFQSPRGMAVYTSHTINAEERKPLDRVKTSGKGMESRVGLLSSLTESLIMDFVQADKIMDPEECLFLVRRQEKDSWIFPETSNKHFKAVAGRVLDLQDGDNLTQYCLRHTYATYRRGNVDEKTLAIMMGHSGSVRDNYDHRSASMVISMLDKSRDKIFQQEEPAVVSLSQLLDKQG